MNSPPRDRAHYDIFGGGIMADEEALARDMTSLAVGEPHSQPHSNEKESTTYKPRVTRQRGPMVQDITAEFTKAASGQIIGGLWTQDKPLKKMIALKTGELVKDEYFTLFESVGALEIMDPKMDSGYLADGDTLDDDYDVLQELLPEEVIGIMDQMLCYEMAWHMGYSLSQSLFTSLYIDKILWPEPRTLDGARFDRGSPPKQEKGLVHLVLRAYCLGLIKTCDFIHRRVCTEHYYEEEDFVLSLYNRNLLSTFAVDDIMDLLNNAQEWIGSQALGLTEPLKRALNSRIELRAHLLAAVNIDQIIDRERAEDWKACIELLSSLKETSSLGKPVGSSFSVKLQRKLASTVPPRAIVDVKFEDAWDLLSSICQSGRDAYRILDYHGGTHLQNFVWSFQSRTPQPPAYIRCLLQSLIFNDMKVLGVMSFKRLLFEDLEEIALPADILVDDANADIEAPQDPRFQIAKRMDQFVNASANTYIDIFRTLCMNRSRLRRMLCHLILDWDSLQFEAEGIDIDLRKYTNEEPIQDEEEEVWSFPLSSWAYYHKLQQLEWIVQMGFELEVYKADELGGMYWHLQHLIQTRIQHIERIRTFTTRRLSNVPTPTARQKAAFRHSISFLDFAMLQAYATQSFASGLSSLYSFLAHLGLMKAPSQEMPYSTSQLRYTLRMRPLLAISLPEVPSYDQFISSISLRPDAKASSAKVAAQAMSILNVAERAFKGARKDWDAISKTSAEIARCQGCEEWWKAGVKDVLRSVIVASIAVTNAKKALNSVSNVMDVKAKVKVTVGGEDATKGKGRGYHAWWIVPDISPVM